MGSEVDISSFLAVLSCSGIITSGVAAVGFVASIVLVAGCIILI